MTEPETNTETKKSKKTPLLILIVAVLGAVSGAGWWFFLRPATAKGDDSKPEPKIQATLHLDSFVVNLADPDGNHFLRVGIDLGLAHPLPKESGESNSPSLTGPIRDAIVEVLSTRQSDVLLTAAGKTKLKQELVHALQQEVPQIGVQKIYFTDFLVQR